jgi:uncharacterized protein YggU (UPF0235/DUF167 family)
MPAGLLKPFAGGIDVFVRVTTRSSADRIGEIIDSGDGRPRLTIHLRAIPEKGKANTALRRLIAAALHVPPGAVWVCAGETSRLKTVRIEGDAPRLEASLARCVHASPPLLPQGSV